MYYASTAVRRLDEASVDRRAPALRRAHLCSLPAADRAAPAPARAVAGRSLALDGRHREPLRHRAVLTPRQERPGIPLSPALLSGTPGVDVAAGDAARPPRAGRCRRLRFRPLGTARPPGARALR